MEFVQTILIDGIEVTINSTLLEILTKDILCPFCKCKFEIISNLDNKDIRFAEYFFASCHRIEIFKYSLGLIYSFNSLSFYNEKSFIDFYDNSEIIYERSMKDNGNIRFQIYKNMFNSTYEEFMINIKTIELFQ